MSIYVAFALEKGKRHADRAGKGIRGRWCHNLNHTETKFVDQISIDNGGSWIYDLKSYQGLQGIKIVSPLLLGGLSKSHEGAKSLPSLSRAHHAKTGWF